MIKRNANIELLRCVLMFGIVFWHCSMCCPDGDVRVSKFLACLPVFSVDAFILISGWYGVSFSWRKVMRLVGLGLFSAVVVCGVLLLVDEKFVFRYSLGWFGLAYLALLVLSPLLNAGLDALEKRGDMVQFWIAYTLLVVVSWCPIAGFGIDLSIPGFGGKTFNTMLYVYVTGRLLRTCNKELEVRQSVLFLLFVVLCVMNVALAMGSGLTKDCGCVNLLFSSWRVNDSPLVVALAVIFFLLFMRINVPNRLGALASFLAPSMFSVYLLHCGTNFAETRMIIGQVFSFAERSVAGQVLATLLVTAVVFSCVRGWILHEGCSCLYFTES